MIDTNMVNDVLKQTKDCDGVSVNTAGWAIETMTMINKLTPEIKGKAFDPGWFLLRERLEEAEHVMNAQQKEVTHEA